MTITKIIEITDNNNPASVMHDDPREALAQVHALALGIASVDVAGINEPSALWAEIHRLRAELAGPDGFVTWKDAAIAERRRRVEFERSASAPARFCYVAKWRSESGHECMEIFNDIHPAREFLDLRGVVGQIVSMSIRGQGYVDALKGA